MPQVADPFFRKSVILLLSHEDEGSFGFIVNRRTELKVAEILTDLKLAWGGDEDDLAQFGGPVQPQVGTVLYSGAGDELPPLEAATEVFPGIHLTQHIGELATLAGRPPHRFRLFLGYAGWGEGQLVSEILRNDWLIAPVDPELVFGGSTEAVWEAAISSVGGDSSTIPPWTAKEPESPAT
mgnify:FL=1